MRIKLDERITLDLTPKQRASRLSWLRAERRRLLNFAGACSGMEALQYTVQAVQAGAPRAPAVLCAAQLHRPHDHLKHMGAERCERTRFTNSLFCFAMRSWQLCSSSVSAMNAFTL